MSTFRTHAAALTAASRAFARTGRKPRITRDRVYGSGRPWSVTDPEGVTT